VSIPYTSHAAWCAALVLISSILFSAASLADDVAETSFADGLTGLDIYERVVANRFRSFSQVSRLISADRAGREQESRFHMQWKDFRDADGNPTRGVLSKTLVKYTHPFDLRFSGFLVQANHDRLNDQFVYYPSRRRVMRVNLRSEAVYGTDFSFEDVVPREAEDFAHRRVGDEEIERFEVYVVELFPREIANSEYSRIRVYVEKRSNVVVRARYWDSAGVQTKEFHAPPSRIREFDGVFVPMKATMRNLLLESYTTLVITEIDPNPRFSSDTFDLGRLESH
jgi:hypothetical protein